MKVLAECFTMNINQLHLGGGKAIMQLVPKKFLIDCTSSIPGNIGSLVFKDFLLVSQ